MKPVMLLRLGISRNAYKAIGCIGATRRRLTLTTPRLTNIKDSPRFNRVCEYERFKPTVRDFSTSTYLRHRCTRYLNMPSNVEIKAKVRDPEALTSLALDQSEDGQCDVMQQVDTFFHAPKGYLKLREIKNKAGAQLIAYQRDIGDMAKESKYNVTLVQDPQSLKITLGLALGVRGVVKKTRKLIMIGQTRVHIDDVEGLGTFMELEVMLQDGQTQKDGSDIAHTLMESLNIHQSDLVSGAYMDMLQR